MQMETKVSEFLVSTCRMNTEFNLHYLNLFLLPRFSYSGISGASILCGSRAEFYIQPINPCIDDIDVICVYNGLLALDSNCEILEDVSDLSDVIQCCKLESYEHNKSFVRLRDPTAGVYDWKSEE